MPAQSSPSVIALLLLSLGFASLTGCGSEERAQPTAAPITTSPIAEVAAVHAAKVPEKKPLLSGGEFVGTQSCRECHADQFELWRGSHHDLAMQQPTTQSVLGDFNNAEFDYSGVTTRFYREDDKYMVLTDGEDGTVEKFEVAYVFGVYPLQQYLLPLSRGRLQALSIAWDARPKEEGGQRWYHLYPDELIDHLDPLHWTGPYQNWNSRCAECHSTDVHKDYDRPSDTYDTRFADIDVGCEACHGPGEDHVALAQQGTLGSARNKGLSTDLQASGAWKFAEGIGIAQREEPLASSAQLTSCARCHARRGNFGEYQHGVEFLQTHRLSLPVEPLYFPDGQIRDEVYVHGSFLQSKMHQAGVVCSNCHEPHSTALRAPGNAVCAQCHSPAVYDSNEHHHHETASTGALCANCHMPETTYMGVDPRRDHSMRIPRPDFSLVMGTPNACNQCHTDQDAQWSLDALRNWGVNFHDTSSHASRAFAQLNQGDNRALPTLAALAANHKAAPIWRAAALERAAATGARELQDLAARTLRDPDPLLRTSAVRALHSMPIQQRFSALMPITQDDVTAVRMAVAEALATVPLEQLIEEDAQLLGALFEEYTATLELHSDMPGVLVQLGLFYANQGDTRKAERLYRDAIAKNSLLLVAYLNLADLLRGQSRDDDARKVLLQVLEINPDSGSALHALGLLETRTGDTEKALSYLRRAAEMEEAGTRHRFVYAIALHDLGKPQDAINTLKILLRAVPGQQDALLALANYHAELDEFAPAAEFARQLTESVPDNPSYQRLYQQMLQAHGSKR